MENLNLLKGLFDEKIINIMGVFIKNPYKQFSLSEVAEKAGINVSTTFRVLNKLSEQGFLKVIMIGKIKIYQLERNDKTYAFTKLIKMDDEDPLEIFIERVKSNPRIKMIILESKSVNEAKVLIVGDYIPKDRIQKISDEIKEKHKFKIIFAEIFESQFEDLKDFQNYGLKNKIVWKRTEPS
jgi:cobalamin biosynthesis Co2+ chelatase CbiK